jgi:hypothetical protein
MSLFSQLVVLVISLAGILCGIALTYIAPEELSPGRKYFILGKWLLWAIFIISSTIFFYQEGEYISLIILVLAFILIYLSEISFIHRYRYIFMMEYLVLIITLLLLPARQSILATIIFIYGLPAGTLLIISEESAAAERSPKHEAKTG